MPEAAPATKPQPIEAVQNPAQPEPIPDSIRNTLNLKVETDQFVTSLAESEDAVLVCAIAPYASVRISPVQEVSAVIGLHEEFAFEALIDEITSLGYSEQKLMMLLNSPGGGLHSSFKVARAIRQSFKEIEIYVPHMAASGGTLIALAADKIVMGIMSQLSPLDPQIYYNGRQISALSGRHAYNRICKIFENITKEEAPYPAQAIADKLDPFIMEDWNCAIETAEDYSGQILQLANYKQPDKLAHELIHHFADHDSDINFDTAKHLGIRVERHDANERNKKVWRIFRAWLGKFLFLESGTHVIRYVLPKRKEGKGDDGERQAA
ncbi:MAG TPA: ATP-dependent Clp protease proteolytic subunit [Terriglobales bacterium]|nr:ATP-dependent Clp protease proteolytic subunit [Terriglobales bacterium]